MNGVNRQMRICVWGVTLCRWITVPQPFGRNVAPSSSGAEMSNYYLDISAPEDEGSAFLQTVGEH
jgi:hypothetical protein